MWRTVLRFLSEWCCLLLSCKKLRTSTSNLSFIDTGLWLCHLASWIRGPDLPPLEQLSLERHSLLKPSVSSDSVSSVASWNPMPPRMRVMQSRVPDQTLVAQPLPFLGSVPTWGSYSSPDFGRRRWRQRGCVFPEVQFLLSPTFATPDYHMIIFLMPLSLHSHLSPTLPFWNNTTEATLPDLISLGHFRQ